MESNPIPIPLNINIWKPIDKKIARNSFNLPKNSHIILFAVAGTAYYNKGFDLLELALNKIYEDKEIEKFVCSI